MTPLLTPEALRKREIRRALMLLVSVLMIVTHFCARIDGLADRVAVLEGQWRNR